MGVGIEAQLVLHGLGEVAPTQLEQVLEEALQHPDDGRDGSQGQQLVAKAGDAHRRQQGVLLFHDRVHRHADQQWWRQVEHLVQHTEHRGDDHVPAVPGGVVPEAGERVAVGARRRGWLLLGGRGDGGCGRHGLPQ